jgi:hypothetical protein
MFTCVGVMWSTPVKTFNAGRKVVAPNGDIRAETETRKMIHIFAPFDQIEYGGPETCLCKSSGRPFFSTSASFEQYTGPAASSEDVPEPALLEPMVRACIDSPCVDCDRDGVASKCGVVNY